MDLERIRYIGEPVAFHLKEGVKELLDSLKAIEFTPALVIVDTLAATAPPGFDENSAAHFGEFLFGVQELQRALGCAILINHHTGWEGTRERGSSAFGARVDVKLFAERVGRTTTRLTVRKARDFAEGESLLLQLVPVGESVIVERAQNADALADGPRTVLKVLHDAPTALKLADWLERSPFERTKFYQLKAELVKAELVEKNELGAWYPSQKGVALLVSENGSRTTRGQSADSGVPNRSGSPSALRISRYGREPNGALNHESAHQNGQGSYEDDEREGMGR
jgi:hypothetical protein